MKIGYPCINRSINCTAQKTFRLSSYSEDRLIKTVEKNLSCLFNILRYNKKYGLLFFRIGSDLIPFASHPICTFNWQYHFQDQFYEIGKFIKEKSMRISMHPGHFTIINSPNKKVVQKSIRELEYHCDILDLMELDATAKIQIHVGGLYGNKEKPIDRFCQNYRSLPQKIKKRVVIENDHRIYSLKNCLKIFKQINIPIVFDILHHCILNNKETIREAVIAAILTWQKKDGLLMIDYSNQDPKNRIGTHAQILNIRKFKDFLRETQGLDFDMMIEIKDKEQSALKALNILKNDKRISSY